MCRAVLAAAHKRKKKKRRKRKTPKTSSSRGRPHRRLWQWHVPGWSWCCSSRCVPVAGFAGYDAHRAVSSFVALADEARGDSTGAVLVQGDMPVVVRQVLLINTVQKTVDIPQLPFFRSEFCRGAEGDSHGRLQARDARASWPVWTTRNFRALLPCRSHARCVQRQVPLVLETVQAQFSDVLPVPVLCYDTCPWCSRQCRRSPQLHLRSPP